MLSPVSPRKVKELKIESWELRIESAPSSKVTSHKVSVPPGVHVRLRLSAEMAPVIFWGGVQAAGVVAAR